MSADMAVRDTTHDNKRDKIAFLNNPRIRSAIYQIGLVVFLGWLVWLIVANVTTSLESQRIATGWGFLDSDAGFSIIQKLVSYTEASSYGRALLVGFLNTLLMSFLGIVFATVLGFAIGVARLSSNWIVARVATTYIEVIRNIPLLLQIFFWYFSVLRALPGKREKIGFLDMVYLNITGFRMPKPIFESGSWVLGVAVLLAVAGIIFLRWHAKKQQQKTGRQMPVFLISLAILIFLPLIAFFIVGMPISMEYPVFRETGPIFGRGFIFGKGIRLIPEFIALFLALTIYTAAFIAEIVRAGIMAVDGGQSQAARALGMHRGLVLRLVVIPQAMKIIIPPLTSQYLNLTKNSSLAVAIAYPDLVLVGGIVLSQTGQAVEIVVLWMAVYLSISIFISFIMSWYNRSITLTGR